MYIKCPYCEAKLNVGSPKPGRYKPKCKKCTKPFVLQVGEGDPPKVAIGKIKPKPSLPNADETLDAPQETLTDEPVKVSKGATPNADQTVTNVDATRDAAAIPGASSDETIAPQNDSHVEATMDSQAAEMGSAGSVGASETGAAIPVDQSKSVVRSGGAARKTPAAAGGGNDSSSGEVSPLPDRLGGYRITRVLGRGAMGAVYEAKQLSLDRVVALKTIRGKLVDNPASLARFTREAYAAAQLTHHNVVQIYDFGEDDGRHFFSMEWVRGGPLSDLIKDKGPIEPKLAVGYMLQAARGLQFAHQNGMVHRDVKPANLLVSDEGVVKVADLGLVKIPDLMDPEPEPGTVSVSGMQSGTQVTMQGTAVGTPAYMAPEQGIDAASVDHRADIYSLGCSLYFLLAGKPPFDGSVVSEVLEQHAKQPIPELSQVNARIPETLQSIVDRSMAKRPDDRYDSLSEMIREMESFLGITSQGDFSPTTEQADQWEAIAKRFASSAPLLSLTGPLFWGFVLVCGLLTIGLPFIGIGWLLFGPAMFVSAIATTAMMGAAGGGSAIATNVRRWIGTLSWFDYVVGVVGAIVFVLVVFATGIWSGFLMGVLAGIVAGAAYQIGLLASSRKSQSGALMDAEKFIRDLRIGGADEDGIRSFVARYSGKKKWQGIYEALFGYDSLRNQRDQLKSDASFSGTLAVGPRDRLCNALVLKITANKQARDHKQLAKVEERGLASQGVSASEARERAWQMASAVMENARIPTASSVDAEAAAEAKRARMKAMMADARSGKYKRKRDPLAPVKFMLGGQTRLLVGCLILATFAFWAQNNGLIDTVTSIANQNNVNAEEAARNIQKQGEEAPSLIGANGLSVGIAGLLLAMSSFVSGWRMTPFGLVATIVILYGASLGIPTVGPIAAWIIAAAVGVAVYVPGVIWGETTSVE